MAPLLSKWLFEPWQNNKPRTPDAGRQTGFAPIPSTPWVKNGGFPFRLSTKTEHVKWNLTLRQGANLWQVINLVLLLSCSEKFQVQSRWTWNRYSFCDSKQTFASQNQKIQKIPQDRRLKSEMVAYVEKNLWRIKMFIYQKLFLGYKFESHCGIWINPWTIMGIHQGKCYITYRYHITTDRNICSEVVPFAPKPLPEVKPKLLKILCSYKYCKLMVMTIYLCSIDDYHRFIKSYRILGSVTAFVNDGQTSTIKFQEGFWAACMRIFFSIFWTQPDTANYDFLKA